MSSAPAPVCHVPSCGATLVRREHPDALAASLGVWYDHPPLPAGHSMIGHTASNVTPHATKAPA